MCRHAVDPQRIYSKSPLFLDYLAQRPELLALFQRAPTAFHEAAVLRSGQDLPRAALCDALADYSRPLDASARTLDAIERLREPGSLCVLTGQQAGFLGGPAYTAYKILTAIRLARHLSGTLDAPIIPTFWLASEDHDFTEINRARWLDTDGTPRSESFDWEDRGCAIEALPLTDEIRATLANVTAALTCPPDLQDLLSPREGDDYCRWHARIWSRLFADDGLVVIEPRAFRHLAGPFFERAFAQADAIRDGLEAASHRLESLGFTPALDARTAGRPFRIDAGGKRTRVSAQPYDPSAAYSADAALRPVLADSLFPTVASVLGPGEIAYHAQLRPIYEALGVPQPVVVPRHGYTVLSGSDASLLDRLGVSVGAALDPAFDPQPLLDAQIPDALRQAFTAARRGIGDALLPLAPLVRQADPGLEARWRQVSDRADREIAQLGERVARAELARAGVSVRRLRATIESLHPGGQPQERVLSLVHFLARFGVQWLHQLPEAEHPDRFSHEVVTIHDQP